MKFDLNSLIALCLGTAMYNCLKKSAAFALPAMRSELEYSKRDIGLISSSFAVSYGVSKFIFGILSDFSSSKTLFSLGLFTGSALLFLSSLVSGLHVICFIWFLSGIVHGMGGPSLGNLVVLNFDKSYRGTVWSVVTNVGYIHLIVNSL